MILHDPISGETTPLPSQGQFDYSSKRTSSSEAAQIRLQHRPFGHVLQVVSGPVSVNDTPVCESALLYPGDQLVVGNTRLLFVCDDNLPPQCTDPGLVTDSNRNSTGKQDQEPDSFSDNLPANETTGIRWLSGPDRGHFQSINGNTFIPCGTVHLVELSSCTTAQTDWCYRLHPTPQRTNRSRHWLTATPSSNRIPPR